jgi:hypothetical protein
MSFRSVEQGSDGGPYVLAKIAASGSIRTRKDAECFRDQMLKGGYDKECMPLFRALLAVLGDNSALQLPEPAYTVARTAYFGMMKHYIGNSDCRCLRNATGGVAVNLTTCPVHGETPGAKPGFRNLEGLMR